MSPPSRQKTSATALVDGKIDVAAVLRTLAPEHREVVVMREFDQMSYAEIAQVLEIPIGTVESRLHRARAELRAKLDDYAV
jgi:RNA polymerase sigma-70 factor (ECF subfamily)